MILVKFIYLCIEACLVQLPRLTAGVIVAKWTHHRTPSPIDTSITYITDRYISAHAQIAIGNNKQASDGRKDQPGRVESKPREVKGQLFAKIQANQMQGLVDK